MSPDRQIRRLRILLAIAAVVIGSFGLQHLTLVDPLFEWRVGLTAWVKDYDGCLCDDCLPRFLGLSRYDFQVAVPFLGYGDHFDVGLNMSCYAGALLALAAFGRTPIRTLVMVWVPRSGTCPSCRYNLKGLPPGAPCPECGRLPAHELEETAD